MTSEATSERDAVARVRPTPRRGLTARLPASSPLLGGGLNPRSRPAGAARPRGDRRSRDRAAHGCHPSALVFARILWF